MMHAHSRRSRWLMCVTAVFTLVEALSFVSHAQLAAPPIGFPLRGSIVRRSDARVTHISHFNICFEAALALATR